MQTSLLKSNKSNTNGISAIIIFAAVASMIIAAILMIAAAILFVVYFYTLNQSGAKILALILAIVIIMGVTFSRIIVHRFSGIK